VLTYRQFARQTATLAASLKQRLAAGSRVLIVLSNSRDLPIWTLACTSGNLVPVLCDPGAVDGDLSRLVQQFNPALIVSEAAGLRRLDPSSEPIPFTKHRTSASAFLITTHPSEGGMDVYGAICTSGSSGPPKGVLLSQASWLESCRRLIAALDLKPQEVALHSAPLAHGSGMLFAAVLLLHGTNIIVNGFNTGTFLDAADRWRSTVAFLVPTMLYDLLEQSAFSPQTLPAMRTLNYSGGPASASLVLRAAARWGSCLVQDYGLWEAPAPQLVLSKADHEHLAAFPNPEVAASSGRPMHTEEFSILRPSGDRAPVGEVGEVVLSGPTLMSGYLHRSHIDSTTINSGRLWTGDLAKSDANGYVTLVGRQSSIVVTGGKKVSPERVESVLSECAEVREIVVVGVPHERWGEMVVALVVPVPGKADVQGALSQLALQHLAPHERPKLIIPLESLPTGPSGKRRRDVIAAIAQAEVAAARSPQ
jgi:acyl-CoA synthetase (AMP-forming)/AMP-acid ligase II